MTTQGVSGAATAIMLQTPPDRGDSAQQGWLRELERAQAAMFGSHSHAGHGARQERNAESSDASPDLNKPRTQKAVAQAPAVASWIAPQAPQTAVTPMQSVSPLQIASLAHLAAKAYASATGSSAFVREMDTFEASTKQVPETGDTRPGREAREFSRNSFKLVRSGDDVVDAAVRDPAITLESELRLGQQIRTAVQAAGSKLGKVWLNGRAVMNDSQGEKNGN